MSKRLDHTEELYTIKRENLSKERITLKISREDNYLIRATIGQDIGIGKSPKELPIHNYYNLKELGELLIELSKDLKGVEEEK